MTRRKIAFLTTQVSPFQAELAAAVAQLPGIEYRVLFSAAQKSRPPHWSDLDDKIAEYCRIYENSPLGSKAWSIAQLREFDPDAVIVGGIRGDVFAAAQAHRRSAGRPVPTGAWMEGPLLSRSLVRSALRRLDYAWRLARYDFVLSIGDRAYRYHSAHNRNTHFVPYGEDLSHCLAAPLPKPQRNKMRFLFSGGLHPRHNFPMIMAAFADLLRTRGNVFELVLSGHGTEQTVVDAAIAREPRLADVIIYDRDFDTWRDRLRPFIEADVLIYPTDHAGWGLVVPEAMAAGTPVISSHYAEASRYLITDRVDGLFVDVTRESFLGALHHCLDHPEDVARMAENARVSARRGDAHYVAEQLINTLRIATHGMV